MGGAIILSAETSQVCVHLSDHSTTLIPIYVNVRMKSMTTDTTHCSPHGSPPSLPRLHQVVAGRRHEEASQPKFTALFVEALTELTKMGWEEGVQDLEESWFWGRFTVFLFIQVELNGCPQQSSQKWINANSRDDQSFQGTDA